MATSGKGTATVGYNVQIAVDAEHHLIVAHEVTNQGYDRHQLAPMAFKAQQATGCQQITALADRGYFSGPDIRACELAGITTYVPKPLTSASRKKGLFTKRDFIYVADCTRAMLWLAEARAQSGLFNLGTGRARSFKDLMLAVGKAVGKDVTLDFRDMPEAIRPNYQYFTEARMQRLREVGYAQPFTTLEDGVAEYVQRYLLQPDPYL